MLSYYVSIQGNIIDLSKKNLDIVCNQIMNPKINLGNSILISENTPLRAIKKALESLIPYDKPHYLYMALLKTKKQIILGFIFIIQKLKQLIFSFKFFEIKKL